MKYERNIMNLHDVELFNMITNNWGNWGRGTTTTWKRDVILDKIFVGLAKKLEKKSEKSA